MASQSAASYQLNYGTQPPAYRRWLRLFGMVAAVGAIAIAVWLGTVRVHRRYLRYLYRREVTNWYPLAANYVDQPNRLRGEIDVSGDFKPLNVDPFIDRLPLDPGDSGNPEFLYRPFLFVHERTNAAGITRLLMVETTNRIVFALRLNTFQIARRPDGTYAKDFVHPTFVGLGDDYPVRFYAGQPDPVDPASFYIPIECGERRGRLCGTFLSDESLNWTLVLADTTTTRTTD